MSETLGKLTVMSEEQLAAARALTKKIALRLGFSALEQIRLAAALFRVAGDLLKSYSNVSAEFIEDVNARRLLIHLVGEKAQTMDSATPETFEESNAVKHVDELRVKQTGHSVEMQLVKRLPAAQAAEKQVNQNLSEPGARALLRESYSGGLTVDRMSHQYNDELLRVLDELSRRQGELNQLNQELDDTNRGVVALYAELDQKNRELQELDKAKNRFFSSISHEFRTPLISSLNLSKLLITDEDAKRLQQEQVLQIDLIRQSMEHLLKLTNDLLDLAKAESGTLILRPSCFSLQSLLNGIKNMALPLLRSERVTLEFPQLAEDVEIHTDEKLLSQILLNLVSNAIKFTEQGAVSITLQQDGDSSILTFLVKDTGIGIPDEFHQQIFEEFTQVNNPLQIGVQGTGLGLPLVKHLARVLGGEAGLVWSEVGKGTEFFVAIPGHLPPSTESNVNLESEPAADISEVAEVRKPPLAEDVDAPRGSATPQPNSGQNWGATAFTSNYKPLILMIDDEPATNYVLKHQFQYQCDIIDVTSPHVAMAIARQVTPSAVVVDMIMGQATGLEVLEQLNRDDRLRDIPVFVYSSLPESHELIQEAKPLANGVFGKSGDAQTIVSSIMEQIGYE